MVDSNKAILDKDCDWHDVLYTVIDGNGVEHIMTDYQFAFATTTTSTGTYTIIEEIEGYKNEYGN